MRKILGLTLIAAFLGMFVTVPSVHAHRPEPGSDEGVTLIPNPTTSYAFYREIDTAERVHSYRFEADAGQFFHAGINIPQLSSLQDFAVTMALLGPGLPQISDDQLRFEGDNEDADHHTGSHNAIRVPSSAIAELPSGSFGGLVVESRKTEDFFEPFTQTRYWGRQQLELNLPESGTFYLLIWNPEGETGKYVLDTGTVEVFGLTDLFRFPFWWLSTRVYFEQTPQLVGASVVLLAGALGFVVYHLRR